MRKERARLAVSLVPLPALTTPPFTYSPLVCRGHLLGGLDSDIWVPFSRRKDDDLIQKLVDASDQILPIAGFIGHVAEELAVRRRRTVSSLPDVSLLPTSREHAGRKSL